MQAAENLKQMHDLVVYARPKQTSSLFSNGENPSVWLFADLDAMAKKYGLPTQKLQYDLVMTNDQVIGEYEDIPKAEKPQIRFPVRPPMVHLNQYVTRDPNKHIEYILFW